MSDEIVTLARFANPIEAEMAKNRLADEGIPSSLSGEMTSAVFGMNNLFGEVQLLVAERYLQRARAILANEPEEDETDDKEPVPEPSTAIKARDWAAPPAAREPAEPTFQAVPGITPAPDREAGLVQAVGADLPAVSQTEKDGDDADDREQDYKLHDAWGPDDYATLAWKAALIGLVILPPLLHVYSLSCLVRLLFFHPGDLSAAGQWNVVRALVLDGLVIFFVLLVLVSSFH
jgi:hypothetical protein